jgi:hypothetical protein
VAQVRLEISTTAEFAFLSPSRLFSLLERELLVRRQFLPPINSSTEMLRAEASKAKADMRDSRVQISQF